MPVRYCNPIPKDSVNVHNNRVAFPVYSVIKKGAMQDNFVEYIERSIRDHWNLNAFSDYQGETRSYGEVASLIYSLHAFFKVSGLSRGAKVALLGRNSANWATCYLAVVSYGAAIVPILPDFHPSDIENIVTHSDSEFLLTTETFFSKLDISKMGGLKAVFSLGDFKPLFEMGGFDYAGLLARSRDLFESTYRPRLDPKSFTFDPVLGDELASIVYTSGTTGFSKGVMTTHANIISNLVYARANVHLKSGETILSFLPLSHTFGNAFEFIFPFSRGCHITFLGKMPTTGLLIEAFSAIKPRMVLSVPLVIEKIYYKQVKPLLENSKMKKLMRLPVIRKIIYAKVREKILGFFGGNVFEVIIGGASFNSEVEDFLTLIRFPFTVGYGMTECAPLIGYADWRKRSKASSGKLVDRMEIKIDGSSPLGEICVRGENVTKGYYKNPEETARAIDAERWLHTGDLGSIGPDGSIYIRGRSKTMILGASGQNIYPEEIEAKLNNLPLVGESLVLEEGGKLTALVHPDLAEAEKQGVAAEAMATMMEQNRLALNKQLPEYGRIATIRLHAEEFMKTPTNKIKRFLYVSKE
jgi:long-chain acyl-CoA synthetase